MGQLPLWFFFRMETGRELKHHGYADGMVPWKMVTFHYELGVFHSTSM